MSVEISQPDDNRLFNDQERALLKPALTKALNAGGIDGLMDQVEEMIKASWGVIDISDVFSSIQHELFPRQDMRRPATRKEIEVYKEAVGKRLAEMQAHADAVSNHVPFLRCLRDRES